MKHLYIFLIFLPLLARTQHLSNNSSISIISCSPGKNLYEAFGHSAIRVKDEENNIDFIYNYGTFDFNTPNFYLKFAQGYLSYMLTKGHFAYFLKLYTYDKRSITEQLLNLTQEERQQLFDFLENNALPENRYYLYDFYFDNCATRIWYAMEKVLGDKLIFRGTKHDTNWSFRKFTDAYTEQHRWGDVGIDLILGSPIDRIATAKEQIYLPDLLKNAFAEARIMRGGEEKKLVRTEKKLNKIEQKEQKSGIEPTIILGLTALIILSLSIIFRKKNYSKTGDIIIFSFFSLIGIIITMMWFLSEHKTAIYNYNLLWTNPLQLILLFLIIFGSKTKTVKTMLIILLIPLLLCLLCFNFLPQKFDIAFIPLMLIILLRYFVIWFKYPKFHLKK